MDIQLEKLELMKAEENVSDLLDYLQSRWSSRKKDKFLLKLDAALS